MGLAQLCGMKDMFFLFYQFHFYHFSYYVKHQTVNSLKTTNIFFVYIVKLIRHNSARKVVKFQLILSQGTLARHDPLSGQTLPS